MNTMPRSQVRQVYIALLALAGSALNTYAEFPTVWSLKRDGGAFPEAAVSISVGTFITNSCSFVAGTFGPSATIAGTTFTNTSGYSNVFLASYQLNGNPRWAKAPTINGPISGVKVAGGIFNPLLVGNFYGTNITFAGLTLTNRGITDGTSADIFLAYYSGPGNVSWVRQLGGTLSDTVSDTASLLNDHYVTGWFQSPTFTAGATNLTLQGTNAADGFIVKYDASGNVVWARQAINAPGRLLAIDASSNCIVAGSIAGVATVGGLSLSNQTEGTYVLKLDGSGTPLWLRGDMQIGTALAVDKARSILTTGTFSNTMQFGQTVLSNNAPATIYVAKYDSSGEPVWARQLPGSGNDRVTAITTDVQSNCWVAGSFRAPDGSGEHAFVACLDSGGELLGVAQAGGAAGSVFTDMANAGWLNNYVVGHFATKMSFGGITLTNEGNQDIFVGCLNMVPPQLKSTTTSNSLILSWPVTNTGYSSVVLQTTTDPLSGNWGPPPVPPSSADGWYSLTNSPDGNCGFFRIQLQPAPQ